MYLFPNEFFQYSVKLNVFESQSLIHGIDKRFIHMVLVRTDECFKYWCSKK